MYFRPLLPWQSLVNASTARFKVLNCGRRSGKSSYSEEKLSETALDGYPVGYFAPTVRTTTVMWESLKMRLEPVIERITEIERTLYLTTGGRIECWSLDNPNNGRGRKFKRIVVDEFREVRKQRYAWFKTLRPTLNDYQGDAILASTPNGMDFFHEMYLRGDKEMKIKGQQEYSDWESWTFPTSCNPYILPEEIEQARLDMPLEDFEQEYLAKFIADGGAVFKNVLALATATEQTVAQPAHAYVIGVDFGKSRDFSVFAVYDCTLKAIVHIDRSNQLDLIFQCDRLEKLCYRFHPSCVLVEQNSIGIAPLEMLYRKGLPVRAFQTSNPSKTRIVENMQLAVENQHISFYPNLHLLAEFSSFAKERLPGGMIRYSAPQGYHDDVVMACCFALDAGEYGVPRWEAILA